MATTCGTSPIRIGKYGNSNISGTIKAVKPATSGRVGASVAREDEHPDRQHDGAEQDDVRDEHASDVAAEDAGRKRGRRVKGEWVVVGDGMFTADVGCQHAGGIDGVSEEDARDKPAVPVGVRSRNDQR